MASAARIWVRRGAALTVLFAIALVVWLLLRAGNEQTTPGDPRGASVENLTIDSEAVGRRQPVAVVVPEDSGENAPLLVFLHGRGGDESSELDQQGFFDALGASGKRAPIVAFPDGGDSSYWHDRQSGDWGRYVTEEVIPQVAERFDADSKRVAIGGISMGGYGAYNIAYENPGRFCAVGGHSPALWRTAEETAEGAFDDAEDFAENDVVGDVTTDPSPLAGQPIWLDAGDEDPFLAGDEAFVAALEAGSADLAVEYPPGGHDSDYWNAHWGEYMAFYAAALADCDSG